MPDSPLEVTIVVPDGPQQAGSVVPVRVEVRNTSERELWIVGVLDGSEMGYRFPHYRPSIKADEPIPPPETEGCGNVAPLRLQDFRLLAPRERFDPTNAQDGASYLPLMTFANFAPPRAGRYELRLTLSTEGAKNEDWLGMIGYPGEEQVVERLKQVPRLRVESNIAIVNVK